MSEICAASAKPSSDATWSRRTCTTDITIGPSAILATSHPHWQVHDGEAAVRAYLRRAAAFPDQRNELTARHADDAVIVESWLLGTHRGPLMGTEPTGRSFRCRRPRSSFRGAAWSANGVFPDAATIRRQLTA
jgi:hypothetical protein